MSETKRNKIWLCLAHMSEAGEEMKFIKEAFDTNWVVPLGPNVNGILMMDASSARRWLLSAQELQLFTWRLLTWV